MGKRELEELPPKLTSGLTLKAGRVGCAFCDVPADDLIWLCAYVLAII